MIQLPELTVSLLKRDKEKPAWALLEGLKGKSKH
jgi:hypothetical protein